MSDIEKSNQDKDKDKNLPMSYEDIKAMAKDMFASGFFASIKNPQQALVTILAGRELGMGPFEAMSNIYVVQGKPAFYAHKYGDMIKRTGKYNYKVAKHTETECAIIFYENGEEIGESVFTMDDAKKAGIVNANWQKYPRNMLFARAITNGARWYCPDAFNGAAYEPEELGAVVEYDEQGTQTVIEVPNQPSVTVVQSSDDGETKPVYDDKDQIVFRQEEKFNNKVITDSKELLVDTFTELQSANGRPYAKITFMNLFKIEGINPRWEEYNVSPFVFEEQPEMYRSLENGSKVIVKLTFESKGEKNYQNCEVISKLDDDAQEIVQEVVEETTEIKTESGSVSDDEQQTML